MTGRALFESLVALGQRKSGTVEGRRAGDTILEALGRELPGAEVSEEPFEFDRPDPGPATLTAGGRTTDVHLYDNTGLDGDTVSGTVYDAGYRPTRAKARRMRGRVVVFRFNPVFHRLSQVLAAREAGARGVVLVSARDDHVPRGLGYPYFRGTCPIPVVGIRRRAGCGLSEGAEVRIRYRAERTRATGRNLVVDLPGEGGILVAGAHYDSWCAGAQDNAASVRMLFEMLAGFHRSRRPRHRFRAVFFDAEEIGLIGSRRHVEGAPPDYLYYLNLEMAVPVRGGRLRLLFHSRDRLTRRALDRSRVLSGGIVPFPLSFYYRLFPFFPADLEWFHRSGIPCASTWCHSPVQHTPRDDARNVRWAAYPGVARRLTDLLLAVDRVAP